MSDPDHSQSNSGVGEPGVWFHKVIEAAHEGIGIIDREGRLTYVNPRLAEMVGYTVDEVLGRKFFEFHVDVPPEVGEERVKKRNEGVGESYEVRLRHKNGSDVWILLNANPILNDRGELIASLGMVFDITARRAGETALRESEERFRLAVQSSPDLMFYQDTNLRFSWISKTIPPGAELDIVGLGDFDVIDPIQAQSNFEAKRRVLETGKTERIENKMLLDGNTYHFQTDLVRRSDAQGRVLGVAGYVRDVTASKLAELALIELNTTLEQRVAERTQSHFRQTQILHSVLDGMGDGVLIADEKGNFVLDNKALLRMVGERIRKSVPNENDPAISRRFFRSDGITPYLGPDLPLTRAVRGQPVGDEEVCIRRDGQPDQWLSVTATPLRNEQGGIIGGVAVSRDITERRRAAELLRLSEAHHRELAEHNRLLQEVEHRVGNNLAGLLGLVTVMRGRTRDVDAFADAIESRLRGMAHVHQMLTATGWKSVALRDLITTSALGAVHDAACHSTEEILEGPAVDIVAKQVQPLTLILLELYTNSCKYGAHSVAEGKLYIQWSIEQDADGGKIRLVWRERNGPAIEGPIAPSLGTQLIRAFAARELKGRVEMNFPREGAEYVIEFPIPN